MQTSVEIEAQRPGRRATAKVSRFCPSSAAWFRLSALYLFVGVALGIAMGASGSFALRSVHTHLNLLGWTAAALAGLIYCVYPAAGANRLAGVHFWLVNLGLPPTLGALAALLLGHPEAAPIVAVSQIVVAAGLFAFVVNVFLNVRSAPRESAHGASAAGIETR